MAPFQIELPPTRLNLLFVNELIERSATPDGLQAAHHRSDSGIGAMDANGGRTLATVAAEEVALVDVDDTVGSAHRLAVFGAIART